MQQVEAVGALGALAQDTRLTVFRELVAAHSPVDEESGLSAGELAQRLGVGASALSFHLKELAWNQWVVSRRVGRSVIYSANLQTMQRMVAFLLQDCCAGRCGTDQTLISEE